MAKQAPEEVPEMVGVEVGLVMAVAVAAGVAVAKALEVAPLEERAPGFQGESTAWVARVA